MSDITDYCFYREAAQKCTGCNGAGTVCEGVGTLEANCGRVIKCRDCKGTGVYQP